MKVKIKFKSVKVDAVDYPSATAARDVYLNTIDNIMYRCKNIKKNWSGTLKAGDFADAETDQSLTKELKGYAAIAKQADDMLRKVM